MISIDKMVHRMASLNNLDLCFVLTVRLFFNLTDSNQTRQRKRRRLGELKKKLREKIMEHNTIAACEQKIDTEAACSLSDDLVMPWEAHGDGKQRVAFMCHRKWQNSVNMHFKSGLSRSMHFLDILHDVFALS